MRDRSTRRELVAGTLGIAAASVTGAGLGIAAGADPALADTGAPSDTEVLGKVLLIERLMVLAYRSVIAAGALPRGEAYVAQIQLGHELEHVSAVAGRLQALGAPADTAALGVDRGNDLLAKYHVPGSLTDLHTRDDSIRLLVNLESVAEGAHFTALKTLSHPGLVVLCAQTMACEAQHWTVLSGLRNPGIYVKSVPWPFVTGS